MIFNANKRTLLFSSIGRRVDLIKRFRRASLELGIDTRLLGMDCDPSAPAAKFVDRFFEVPPVDDPKFAPRVDDIFNEESVSDVLPLIHPEIPFWADLKQKNTYSTRIWVGSPAFVELARDKKATKSWLIEKKLGVPETVELGKPGDQVPRRVVLKPRFGCQSLGVRILSTSDYWPRLSTSAEQWVTEEYIDGDEFTIDVFTDYHGEYITAVPRKRIKIRGGEVIKAQTVRSSNVLDPIQKLLKGLKDDAIDVSGPFCVQGLVDAEGVFRITEINARFGGGVPLSLQAGVHYPHMLISGKQRKAWRNWHEDVTMHRFDDASYQRG